MEKFDFIIIGGGSAGLAAAIEADSLGAAAALVESGRIGGTWVNIGCAPAENLNFQVAFSEAREVTARLRRRKFEEPLRKLKRFSYYRGIARFESTNKIRVDGRVLCGSKILIAAGSSPRVPKIDGLDRVGYLMPDAILQLKKPPKSLIVIGAGPLGLECAQMFSHFGTRVSVIQKSEQILSDFEPEIALAARNYMEEDGLDIHLGETVSSVRCDSGGKIVKVKSIGIEHEYRADEILIATGRTPNSAGMCLEAAGVEIDEHGAVVVDDELVTSQPYIFAAGDVHGGPMSASTAIREGKIAALNALNGARLQIEYDSVPSCTFTHPEAAKVGLAEAEAVKRGHRVESRSVDFRTVPKAQIMGDPRGLIKMVMDRETRRLLGCSIVADHAGDIINEAALAVNAGLSVDDIGNTIHVYPTLSEAVAMVAAAFERRIPSEFEVAKEERKAA